MEPQDPLLEICPKLPKERRENSKQYAAFCDYALMGLGRSQSKLANQYLYRSHTNPPPTKNLGTIKDWSVRFDWQKRVEKWDAHQVAEQSRRQREEEEERRKRINASIMSFVENGIKKCESYSSAIIPIRKEVTGADGQTIIITAAPPSHHKANIDAMRGLIEIYKFTSEDPGIARTDKALTAIADLVRAGLVEPEVLGLAIENYQAIANAISTGLRSPASPDSI